jgi:type 1 fimbriae regulatory protein FimE
VPRTDLIIGNDRVVLGYRLIEAARKRGRNGPRDACAILLAYRHGLRAQELCQLRWSQIDLKHGRLHLNRAKCGTESVVPPENHIQG